MPVVDRALSVYLLPARQLCKEAAQFSNARGLQAVANRYNYYYTEFNKKRATQKKTPSNNFNDFLLNVINAPLKDKDEQNTSNYFIRKLQGEGETKLGVAVTQLRVQQVMERFALTADNPEPGGNARAPFSKFAELRGSVNGGIRLKRAKKHLALDMLQIRTGMTTLQSDDGDMEWEDWVVTVAQKLQEAWPLADASLNVCLYLGRHLQFIKENVLTLSDQEYNNKLTEARKSMFRDESMDTTNCHWCGQSIEVAYWRGRNQNAHKNETTLHFCMNCREKQLPDEVELSLTKSKEETEWLVAYVEKAMAARDSILQMEEDELEKLLVPVLTDDVLEGNGMRPHKHSVETLKAAGIESQDRTELKEDLEKYYKVKWEEEYKLNNLKEKEIMEVEETKKVPIIGKIVRFLREKFCGFYGVDPERNPTDLESMLYDMFGEVIPEEYKRGCNVAPKKRAATMYHLDPAWAFNILLSWKNRTPEEEECSGGATWILVAPRRFNDAVAYLQRKKQISSRLSLKKMRQMYTALTSMEKGSDGVW